MAGNPKYVDIWQLPELIGSNRVLNGIVYHELGHNFFGYTDFLKGEFGEALANMGKHYCLEELGLNEYYVYDEMMHKDQLNKYVNEGADFSKINSGIITGMYLTLKDEYGWNFLRNYLHHYDNSLDYASKSYNQKLELFVSNLSDAAGTDLRPRFIQWGFPLN